MLPSTASLAAEGPQDSSGPQVQAEICPGLLGDLLVLDEKAGLLVFSAPVSSFVQCRFDADRHCCLPVVMKPQTGEKSQQEWRREWPSPPRTTAWSQQLCHSQASVLIQGLFLPPPANQPLINIPI